MTLQDLQPYIAAISAGLGVATLGFVLNLVKAVRDNAQEVLAIKEERLKAARDAAQDQMAAKEERLKGAADENARLKEWSAREKSQLQAKLEEAQAQLDMLLKREGIDPSALVAGKRLTDSTVEFQRTIETLTGRMRQSITELAELGTKGKSDSTVSARRTIAMAEMASSRYEEAANEYDAFARAESANWEDHLSRGVAHANARLGVRSDVAALLAYNDALALAPSDLEPNMRARLFTYRAAMLKRLSRLEEAENDLSISIRIAVADYERLDAHYNLACVFAMQGKPEEMYAQLGKIQTSGRFMSAVAAHAHDYFSAFKAEQRFKSLLLLRTA